MLLSMATPPPLPLNFLPQPPFPYPSASSSQNLYFIPYSLNNFRIPRLKLCCSVQTIEIGTQQNSPRKKKRKPRPSFLDQVQEKWSRKTTFLIDKLPWEQRQAEEGEEEEEEEDKEFDAIEEVEGQNVPHSDSIEKGSAVRQPESPIFPGQVRLPPWGHGNKHKKESQLDSETGRSKKDIQDLEKTGAFHELSENNITSTVVWDVKVLEENFDLEGEIGEKGGDTPI